MVCLPEREIINSLKLVDYLLIQAGKPWYNNYNVNTVFFGFFFFKKMKKLGFTMKNAAVMADSADSYQPVTMGVI